MTTIRVASRKSALAMTQTKWVIARMQELAPAIEFHIVPVVTKGDRILDVTLSKVGGKGLFISEIEQCLLDNVADMAVHSMKDMPAELAPGLVLGGIPKREDPRDVFISRTGTKLLDMPEGAVIGTSSLRRMAQIRSVRPDLVVASIRGNIDTRLRKLEAGEFDGILLAASGLIRMGWEDKVTEYLAPDVCLPAVGQGILGIECRSSDKAVGDVLRQLTDGAAKKQAAAERALLQALNGSCQVPLAGYATETSSGEMHLAGLVASEDGKRVIRAEATGNDAETLGAEVAARLKQLGADEILATAAGESR